MSIVRLMFFYAACVLGVSMFFQEVVRMSAANWVRAVERVIEEAKR